MSIVSIKQKKILTFSFSYSDVKDRAVLKVVHLNNINNKSQSSSNETSTYVPFTSRPTLTSEITYQQLSRLSRIPSTTSKNDSIEDKSSSSSSSRSLSEPRRRMNNHESTNSNLTRTKKKEEE